MTLPGRALEREMDSPIGWQWWAELPDGAPEGHDLDPLGPWTNTVVEEALRIGEKDPPDLTSLNPNAQVRIFL